MTVSPVIADSLNRRRAPSYVCYVRRGSHVEVLRSTDKSAVERSRGYLLRVGAKAV